MPRRRKHVPRPALLHHHAFGKNDRARRVLADEIVVVTGDDQRAARGGQAVERVAELDAAVERALRQAALWDEVKDRLRASAIGLSGGQQQRLCIARALATGPEILLLDEPTASLDPLSTQKVEELVYELRQSMTVIIVTHNLQQAARVSDQTVFMLAGQLVEVAPTRVMFTAPADERTEAYITGRFG